MYDYETLRVNIGLDTYRRAVLEIERLRDEHGLGKTYFDTILVALSSCERQLTGRRISKHEFVAIQESVDRIIEVATQAMVSEKSGRHLLMPGETID